MPKKAAGLTARHFQTLKTPGLFADGAGLYLQISASGAKSWIFRFQLRGRRRDMGLGSVEVLGLAEARGSVAAARRLVAEGIDPIKHREAKQAAAAVALAKKVTFRESAKACIEAKRPTWRNAKHASQWSKTLEAYVYPTLGDLAVDEIDDVLVQKVLDPIWYTKPETASRVRSRIEMILDHAKVRKHRAGENPARWKGHLELVYPAKSKIAPVRHHESLPHAEMPAFWPKLQAQDGMGARALDFTILTAMRTGAVVGVCWPEIDFEGKGWRIPGVRMKGFADDQEHFVPLSDPAIALLRKLYAVRVSDFVFPGQTANRPLSDMAMAMTLRRMRVDVTPHGFRASFRTWASEETNFPAEVAEVALAHTQDDKVIAAYQRGDFAKKRRALMTVWASYVTAPPGAKVVQIGQRRA